MAKKKPLLPDDFDLEANQPGAFAQFIFAELGRLLGIPDTVLLKCNQEEFAAVLTIFWEREGAGPFGQKAGVLIQPLIFLLSVGFGLLQKKLTQTLAELFGPKSGGEPLSLSPSPEPLTDGQSETSLDSLSEPPLPTNEETGSGPS